jgi:tetratricopeptide (TPR) repeat protein
MLAKAQAEHLQALSISEKLVGDKPDDADHQSRLAECHYNLAVAASAARKSVGAEAEYRKALALTQQLADKQKGSVQIRSELAGCHEALGWLPSQTNKLADAEAEYRRALAILQSVAAADPAVPGQLNRVAQGRHELGTLLWNMNKRSEAETEFSQALAIQQKLIIDHPTDPHRLLDLATALASVGRLRQTDDNARAQAADAFRQAVKTLEGVPRPTSFNLYDLACYHALLSGVLNRPNTGFSENERRASIDRAMRALRDAVAAGFRNVAHMRTDADLNSLRTSPDFQLLMLDLTFPDDPFTHPT